LSLLKVTPYGDPLLRRQAAPIEVVDDRIKTLINGMEETMAAAGGVGLSAPQVGESIMLFVIDWGVINGEERGDYHTYINPEIIERGGEPVTMQEGCLSLPEAWADVTRPDWIKARYQTVEGEEVHEKLDGYPSRVFQHEFDHLVGVLFIDRLRLADRIALKDTLQGILEGRIKPFDGAMPLKKEE